MADCFHLWAYWKCFHWNLMPSFVLGCSIIWLSKLTWRFEVDWKLDPALLVIDSPGMNGYQKLSTMKLSKIQAEGSNQALEILDLDSCWCSIPLELERKHFVGTVSTCSCKGIAQSERLVYCLDFVAHRSGLFNFCQARGTQAFRELRFLQFLSIYWTTS